MRATDYYMAKTIAGGGGHPSPAPASAARNDVNFYDYDGTIVASYSKSDFAKLSALPDNPDRTADGLTAQGWNWTLADAKTYVASYGMLDIGQSYVTTSEKTEVDIELGSDRLSPHVGLGINGTVTIDWGDGTTASTATGSSLSTIVYTNHTYSSAGAYTITIKAESGSYAIVGASSLCRLLGIQGNNDSTVYQSSIISVRIGKGVDIRDNAFKKCYRLRNISIPNDITMSSSTTSPFEECRSLTHATLPTSVTVLCGSIFKSCSQMQSVSLPKEITEFKTYVFNMCSAIQRICVPNSVTTIGDTAFSSCTSLSEIVIPTSVTTMGGVFSSSYLIPKLIVPSGVTALGGYSYCELIKEINIPSGVTSLGNSAFANCYSATKVTIPSTVTKLGTQAFANCTGVKEYHIQATTPPTLTNVNTFSKIPSDCIIYVPTASVDTYKAADYWTTYASQIQGE